MRNEVLNNYRFSNISSMAMNKSITLIYNSHHKLNKEHTSFINLVLLGIIIFHRCKVTEHFFRTIHLTSPQKIPQFHVMSWCGHFVERHSFRIFPSKIIFSLLWDCEIIDATLLSIQLKCKTSWKNLYGRIPYISLLYADKDTWQIFYISVRAAKMLFTRAFHKRNWRKKYCREKMVIPPNKGLHLM